MLYCCCCGCRLRVFNKALEYIGVVCSTCYRMSNKKYHIYVDKISNNKINFILKEIESNKIDLEIENIKKKIRYITN